MKKIKLNTFIFYLYCFLIAAISACNSSNSGTAKKSAKLSKDRGSAGGPSDHDLEIYGSDLEENLIDLMNETDRLEESAAASDFATLNLKIHDKRIASGDLTLTEDKIEMIGHCLIFVTGGPAFTNDDFKDLAQAIKSPQGRVATTRSKDLRPKDCETTFRGLMPDRFANNFFDLHVSFYGLKQEH